MGDDAPEDIHSAPPEKAFGRLRPEVHTINEGDGAPYPSPGIDFVGSAGGPQPVAHQLDMLLPGKRFRLTLYWRRRSHRPVDPPEDGAGSIELAGGIWVKASGTFRAWLASEQGSGNASCRTNYNGRPR